MKELISSEQMHERYGFHRKKLKDLRDYGLLVGTKYGHGYSYFQEDVDDFFERAKGLDLSNRTKIAASATYLKNKKSRC